MSCWQMAAARAVAGVNTAAAVVQPSAAQQRLLLTILASQQLLLCRWTIEDDLGLGPWRALTFVLTALQVCPAGGRLRATWGWGWRMCL